MITNVLSRQSHLIPTLAGVFTLAALVVAPGVTVAGATTSSVGVVYSAPQSGVLGAESSMAFTATADPTLLAQLDNQQGSDADSTIYSQAFQIPANANVSSISWWGTASGETGFMVALHDGVWTAPGSTATLPNGPAVEGTLAYLGVVPIANITQTPAAFGETKFTLAIPSTAMFATHGYRISVTAVGGSFAWDTSAATPVVSGDHKRLVLPRRVDGGHRQRSGAHADLRPARDGQHLGVAGGHPRDQLGHSGALRPHEAARYLKRRGRICLLQSVAARRDPLIECEVLREFVDPRGHELDGVRGRHKSFHLVGGHGPLDGHRQNALVRRGRGRDDRSGLGRRDRNRDGKDWNDHIRVRPALEHRQNDSPPERARKGRPPAHNLLRWRREPLDQFNNADRHRPLTTPSRSGSDLAVKAPPRTA